MKKIKFKIIIFISVVFFVYTLNININASSILDEGFIEVFNIDGTMTILPAENNDYNVDVILDEDYDFDVIKLKESIKEDKKLILSVMGDGFTLNEQEEFISTADEIINGLLIQYPFNIYKDYIEVYAVKVISNESGVSRDSNTYSNITVDNFFNSSFYGGYDIEEECKNMDDDCADDYKNFTVNMLTIPEYDKVKMLSVEGSCVSIIICNSTRHGGTAGTINGNRHIAISKSNLNGDVLAHELGHAIGDLRDEYYSSYSNLSTLGVNRSESSNTWEMWENLNGRFSGINAVVLHQNDEGECWYKPSNICKMGNYNEPYCGVCAYKMINEIENIFQNEFVTVEFNIGSQKYEIKSINWDIDGTFEIPPFVKIKIEKEGELEEQDVLIEKVSYEAFKNKEGIRKIVLSNKINEIESRAFLNCTNLEEINIPEGVNIIYNDTFLGCEKLKKIYIENKNEVINISDKYIVDLQDIEIVVDYRKYIDYISSNSAIAEKFVANKDVIEKYITCHTELNSTILLDKNDYVLVYCKFFCDNSYYLDLSFESEVKIKIYDEEYICNTIEEEKKTYNFNFNFCQDGFCYIIIDNTSNNLAFKGNLNIYTENISYSKIVYENTIVEKNDVLDHLHDSGSGYFNRVLFQNNEVGFYKITLLGKNDDEYTVNMLRELTIYDNSNSEMKKINSMYNSPDAINRIGEDYIYVYFPYIGDIYIRIRKNTNQFDELYLTIEKANEKIIDSFNENIVSERLVYSLARLNGLDNVEKLIIKQTGKYRVNVLYMNNKNTPNDFILLKQNDDGFDEIISYNTHSTQLDSELEEILILEEGIYYIGYFNKHSDETPNVTIHQIISEYNPNAIVPDPGMGTMSGSYVNIIEKDLDEEDRSYRENYILEGFTRILYLDLSYAPSDSRTDYWWYSSNEDVLKVTSYGTALAMPVETQTSVKVMAVYKLDPSIIFVKEFIVENDTSSTEINIELNQTHELTTGNYVITLLTNEVPYNWLQYYNWSVEPFGNVTATLNNWGVLTVSDVGYYIITGTYILNPRITIIVKLTILSKDNA